MVKRSNPQGIDVSSYQTDVNWNDVKKNGISFAYIKATEGTCQYFFFEHRNTNVMDTPAYKSPEFNSQYTGATNAGIIRGAYHFARPDISNGAEQAKYFAANGGGWSGDGITLPGALDIECECDSCYDLSASEMVSWIQDFSDTYHMIYTTTDWWKSCIGNSAVFSNNNPLWIAHYASSIGSLPAGWSYTSFWQYADHGPNPGDADLWNGDMNGLQHFARG
ncbi:glycoside hydrolase family 25 protein [Scleroderma citrinum Foug A]|uniref:N,O-diacetylmuramidase n=1 Tax=Scleroderma citrinum Foug A TaxID=1036808 RepID=A0A0C3E337_9AGAM|nr:glycoside hydrolase family 25 protein [Scleroderma citrinum Foug A]